MLDNKEAHDDRNDLGQNLPRRDAASDHVTNRPMADREVPLPGLAAADDPSMVAIHQWLDGERTESDARRVDTKLVDMWSQVAGETDRRRRMVTPSYVAANIMNALPDKQMAANVATATTASSAGFSMTTVLMIGSAMLALGILIGRGI
ncbi:MAG: hypothetical protein ABMA00_07090 [Gemmatimonas sp.]